MKNIDLDLVSNSVNEKSLSIKTEVCNSEVL